MPRIVAPSYPCSPKRRRAASRMASRVRLSPARRPVRVWVRRLPPDRRYPPAASSKKHSSSVAGSVVTLAGRSPSAPATSAAGRPGTRSAVPADPHLPPPPPAPRAVRPPRAAGAPRSSPRRVPPPSAPGRRSARPSRRPPRARWPAPPAACTPPLPPYCAWYNDARAVGGRLRDRLPQPGPGQRVDARGRLVEQQEIGCVREHLGERRAPRHSERQVPDGDRRVLAQRIR